MGNGVIGMGEVMMMGMMGGGMVEMMGEKGGMELMMWGVRGEVRGVELRGGEGKGVVGVVERVRIIMGGVR